MKFSCTESLDFIWWLNQPPKVRDNNHWDVSWFSLQHTLQCESRVLCFPLIAMQYSIFFENWQIWNLGSPAKYFCKHTSSDIFPAFCAPFTALVAPLLIFYNNNDEKGKFSTKISYEEIWVFLKTGANNITLGIFFSL